jgi:hypothetical protein
MAVDWIPMPAGAGEGGYSLTEEHLAAFDEVKTMIKGPLTISSGKGGVHIRNKSFTSGNQVFRK